MNSIREARNLKQFLGSALKTSKPERVFYTFSDVNFNKLVYPFTDLPHSRGLNRKWPA